MSAAPPRLAMAWRILLAAWLLACAAAARGEVYEHGLLWQVSRPGVAPSYIFGTVHLPDARLEKLPEPVEKAFAASRRFIMEMYPDQWVRARFAEAARLPPGASLETLVGSAAFDALAERLAAKGWRREQARVLKPWAALLVLTEPQRDAAVVSLDNALYIKARFANLRVEELDTVEEQIAVFDDLPLATQLAVLDAYILRSDALDELAAETLRAYMARDLAALHGARRLMESRANGLAPHHEVLDKKIVHDRSVVMAYRLQPYLRRGANFVAVGALHLYGAKGILGLLAEDGWHIARLY